MKAFFVCFVAGLSLAGCGVSDSPSMSARSTEFTPGYVAMYEVISNGSRMALTYTNQDGGASQETVSSGWTKTISCSGGNTSLYISAQAQERDADIAVMIKSNGKTIRRSDSKGDFVIASISARC